MQTEDKINNMWKEGLSIKEIIEGNGLSIEVPKIILAFTKDTSVCLEKENKTIVGKIDSWDCECCILEYLWNGIPIKRRIDKEDFYNLKEGNKL